MSRKDNNKIPQNSNEIHSNKLYNYNHTVSKGSRVDLDVRDFLDKDIDDPQSYFWKQQPEDVTAIHNFSKDTSVFSFKASYIKDDNVKTQLNFKLTITDNKNSVIPPILVNVKINVKRVQRVIVFQGGVSLGAYEAGVFKALVKKLEEQDVKRGLNGSRPLFDIVAGTSIGAMNGAIVVSDIKNHKKSWKESANDLVKFWEEQESHWPTLADYLDMNPIYRGWWDILHNTGKASKESVSTLTESYSYINSYFKEWTNTFMDCFIDGWYVPATSESARRY